MEREGGVYHCPGQGHAADAQRNVEGARRTPAVAGAEQRQTHGRQAGDRARLVARVAPVSATTSGAARPEVE
jgi:hypothetical protein